MKFQVDMLKSHYWAHTEGFKALINGSFGKTGRLTPKGTGHRGEMNPKEDLGLYTGLCFLFVDNAPKCSCTDVG